MGLSLMEALFSFASDDSFPLLRAVVSEVEGSSISGRKESE